LHIHAILVTVTVYLQATTKQSMIADFTPGHTVVCESRNSNSTA